MAHIQSINKLLSKYNNSSTSERLGQYFCNHYITHEWPELFYCKEEDEAIEMITKYLVDNSYIETLPKYN